jgi:hypothetical protein
MSAVWHIPAVATAAKDGRSRLESGHSAARWLPERELSEKAPGVWLARISHTTDGLGKG